jgi:hypothetical protein
LAASPSRIEYLAPVQRFPFGPFTAVRSGYFGFC